MSKRTKLIEAALGKNVVKEALTRLAEDDALSLEKNLITAKEDVRKVERIIEDNLKTPSLVLSIEFIILSEQLNAFKARVTLIEDLIEKYV